MFASSTTSPRRPDCATSHNQQTTIPSVAAGGCNTRSFTRATAPLGNYTSWVLADAMCALTESNENNNTGLGELFGLGRGRCRGRQRSGRGPF